MEANADSYPILEFREAGTQKWQFFNEPSNDSLNIFAFGTSADNRMTILQNGNVGIGTASPAAELDVKAGSGYPLILDSTQQYLLGLYSSGTAEWWLAVSGGDFKIHENGVGDQVTIKAGGNVGIGTTNPSNGRLQVNGRIYTVGTAGSANAIFQGGQLEFYKDATPTYAASIGLSGPASGGTNDIVFNTYDGTWSERLRITSGGQFGFNTDVTTGVTGNTLYLRSSSSNVGQTAIIIQGYDKTNRWAINGQNGTSNYDFAIFSAPSGTNDWTQRFTILPGGSIGIGTTGPSYKLDVAGNGRYTSDLTINTGTQTQIIGSDGTYGGTYPMYSFTGNTNGSHRIFAGTADDMYFAAATSRGFEFRANGGTSATLKILSNGNVGIGSSSPTAKLDIVGAGSGIVLTFGNTVPNNPLFINTYGGWSGIGMDVSTAGLRLVGDYSGGTNPLVDIGYYSGASVSHSNWVNRVRVLNNGDVGIGTTSPAFKLDVSGTGRFTGQVTAATYLTLSEDGTYTGTYYTLGFSGTSNGANRIFAARDGSDGIYIASATGRSIFFRPNGGTTDVLTVSTSGRVGIGTASPLNKLEVNAGGTIGYSGNDIVFSNSNGQSALYHDSGGYVYWYSTLAITFYPGQSRSVTFATNGNVGIGTTSPRKELDVQGNNLCVVAGQLILGEDAYSTSANYIGLKTSFQSGANDYMILSGKSDGNTYVSAKDGGSVEIRGGGNSSSNALSVPDDSYMLATTSAFRVTGDVVAYYSSDKRLKDNLTLITDAVSKVSKLSGYSFDWNDKQDVYKGHDYGVVAQEVEEVLPELVTTRDNGYKAVKYEKLTVLLIEAIKEQQQQIDELKHLLSQK
jgi:hypothetical protein